MSKSGGASRSVRSVSERRSLSSARILSINLDSLERTSRALPYEYVSVLSPRGFTVAQIKGTYNASDMGRLSPEQSRGMIITHNHPSGSSFSESDIHYAAQRGVREMRVATKDYRYTMRPGREGWSEQTWQEKIAPSYARHEAQVAEEMGAAVRGGKLTGVAAGRLIGHETWRRVARETGLRYTRVAWRQTAQERADAEARARANEEWYQLFPQDRPRA